MHRIPGPFLLHPDRQPHPSPDIMNLQHCNHMILQKKSLLPLVGRAAKVHSIVLPGEGKGEPLLHLLGSVPTNCPFTITRPCTRSVLHAGCAAKLHCPSPRVPESQSLLRIWDTVRTHSGASPLHSELLKAAAVEYCI